MLDPIAKNCPRCHTSPTYWQCLLPINPYRYLCRFCGAPLTVDLAANWWMFLLVIVVGITLSLAGLVLRLAFDWSMFSVVGALVPLVLFEALGLEYVKWKFLRLKIRDTAT